MIRQDVKVNTEGSKSPAICFALALISFFILFAFFLTLFMAAFLFCNEAVLGNPSGSPINAMCRGLNLA